MIGKRLADTIESEKRQASAQVQAKAHEESRAERAYHEALKAADRVTQLGKGETFFRCTTSSDIPLSPIHPEVLLPFHTSMHARITEGCAHHIRSKPWVYISIHLSNFLFHN